MLYYRAHFHRGFKFLLIYVGSQYYMHDRLQRMNIPTLNERCFILNLVLFMFCTNDQFKHFASEY